MKKFKYALCFLLILLFSCCAAACNGNDGPEQEGQEEKITLTEGIHEIQIEHHGRAVQADVYIPVDGTFPLIIFSHGYNGYKDDFKGSAQYFTKEGFGAITFTFCGSGARDTSSLKTTEMTLFTEREDLFAVMDYAKKIAGFNGKLFLAGGSQGGMVSAMAAEARADELAGIALLFPAFNIPVDWKAMWPDDNAVPETIDWMGVKLGRNFVLSMRDLDIFANMTNFKSPVLLMHGTNDELVKIEYSERAAQTYPNAELIKYEGEGHGFTSVTMTKVNQKMLDFCYTCME